jgi:hypothetical protein
VKFTLGEVISHARAHSASEPATAALLQAIDVATSLLQRCILYTAHDNPELCRAIKAHLDEVSEMGQRPRGN